MVGGLAAMAFIVAMIFLPSMGFELLHIVFSIAMVALAAGYILYHTSNIMRHYHTDQHVAAALALFSAVALLFWYILRLVMASRR